MISLIIRLAKSNEWVKLVDIYAREKLDEDVKKVSQEAPKEFQEIGKKRNIQQLTLEVEKSNPKAQKIYEHWGYRYLREGKDPKETVMFKEIA